MKMLPPSWKPLRITVSACSLVVLCGLLAAPQPARAHAKPTQDPETIIRNAIEQTFAVLRDEALRAPERRAERLARIREIADHIVDWKEMARRALGVHWRKFSETQRKRFLALFVDLLANRYGSDFDQFRGTERVVVDGSERLGDEWVVKTHLVTHSGDRVPIHYRFFQRDGRWRAYDVSIEGVSLVNHYRRRFSRFLVNHGPDDLLQRLENQHRSLPRHRTRGAAGHAGGSTRGEAGGQRPTGSRAGAEGR